MQLPCPQFIKLKFKFFFQIKFKKSGNCIQLLLKYDQKLLLVKAELLKIYILLKRYYAHFVKVKVMLQIHLFWEAYLAP